LQGKLKIFVLPALVVREPRQNWPSGLWVSKAWEPLL